MNKFDLIDGFTELASKAGDKLSDTLDVIKDKINGTENASKTNKAANYQETYTSEEDDETIKDKVKNVLYDIGDAFENIGTIIKDKTK